MSFKVSMQLEGVKEAVARLAGIPRAVAKKALKKAVDDASQTLLWAAKSAVPKRLAKELAGNLAYKGGQLKRSLGRKVKVYPSGVAVGVVGARQGFRIEVGVTTRKGKRQDAGSPIFVNPVKYLHLVELGTRHSRGTHFLRDAMAAKSGAIRDAMIATIDEAIQKAAGGAS